MTRLEEERKRFQEFLRERGLKLTQQRLQILERAVAVDEHFNAEELFELLRNDNQRISKATVYRTLALLVEAELLDTHDFERGHTLYERAAHGTAHHDHLICLGCDRVFEFHSEEIEALQDVVAKRFDFQMVSHTHQIYGICGRCQRQGVTQEQVTGRSRVRNA